MSAFDLVETTKTLVSISSVTGNEAEIAQWLENRCDQSLNSWIWAREGHSVWISSPRRAGVPLIGFFGHTDTVPPSGENPVTVDHERITGLGTADMKGGLAVMLALIDHMQAHETQCDALFVFYDKEEGPVHDNGLKPLLNNHPEWKDIALAVCLEPTDNALQLGCVGGIHATLTFQGQAAHSARPWQGDNAVHKAGKFLDELYQRQPVEVNYEGLSFKEVMSVTLAQGGTARNVVPSRFQLNLNYRYAPGKDENQARQDIIDLVDGRCDVEWVEQIPSGKVCLDNTQLKKLCAQKKLTIEAKQAWTDVAQLSAFGVDALNCGPGHPRDAHQVDESIKIDALHENLDIMKTLLD